MNNKRNFFMAPVFLMIILACVVPGLPTASTPLPTLTADTGAIETLVAGTVSAAIAQTQQSIPGPSPVVVIVTASADSTPTPTVASSPTPTYTVTPTFTATPTQNPSQSALTRHEDGSVLFRDDLADYKIKLPLGWLALRINEKEFLDAFSLEEAANTHVQQSLLGIQNEDPNILRLFVFDPSHIQNDFVTDMRFVFDRGGRISLTTDADLQSIAAKIPNSAAVFRFEVTSVKMGTSTSGVDFGVIEARSSFTSAAGADVGLYQKQVFFNVPLGTQSITFTTVADLKEILLPAFDAMLETVTLIEEEE